MLSTQSTIKVKLGKNNTTIHTDHWEWLLQKILNYTTISNQTYIILAKLRSTQNPTCNDEEYHTLNYTVLWINQLWINEVFPYTRTVTLCIHAWLKWKYISNFIHNVLIKTTNKYTFKQSAETTVLVHAFIGKGNTLINSQPSSERLWGLSFSCVSNLSWHQQMATLFYNS